jgi:hypothetical protein
MSTFPVRAKLRHINHVVVAVLLSLLFAAARPGHALGYSPSGAASYADAHWNTCGVSGQYQCINDDCTAFVSEALHSGGGFPFITPGGGIPKGSNPDDNYWYMLYQPATGSYIWSNSFTFAQDLRNFLTMTSRGVDRGTKPGTSLDFDSGGDTGDVLFYDWDPAHPDGGSEPYDHANIIVGFGTSSDGWFGDYIDGHTNNRLHLYWTTRTYNQHIQTTVIDAIHVLASN